VRVIQDISYWFLIFKYKFFIRGCCIIAEICQDAGIHRKEINVIFVRGSGMGT
jgi:hypothetical protein